MIGLFGTLNLASNSLATQQEAMAVAGQNMANVNNPAYARERAVVQTAPTIDTPAGEEGNGATVVSISEVRDALLDSQIRSESSVTANYTTQQSALQNAETYLGEQIGNTSGSSASSANSLAAQLSNLFNSFSSMTTGDGDPATVVQSAQEVANQFNQVSASLSQVQSNLNTSIQNDVASANQDLSQIATLNQQIVLAQAGGRTADDLVDTREQTIENLAGLINISTSAQSDGSINVSVCGDPMVTGGNVTDSMHTYDPGNGQTVIHNQTDTQLSVTGGSIAGAMTARDGALGNLQTGLDTLASQLVEQVNNIYSKGYSSSGVNGQPFFSGDSAANIAVNSTLVADPSQFQASSTSGADGDTQIALELANLAGQPISGLGSQTFSQNYAQTVANLGNAIDTATEELNTSQAVSTSLANQRRSESGVSIDEEMTNIMQFQKAYEASAQLVSTLNAMMQTVINMKSS